MLEELWSIGNPDGPSAVFFDNYKTPEVLGERVWVVGGGEAQRWPLFHPSEADPDAGYRRHPLTIRFDVAAGPSPATLLRIRYLITTPRVPYLRIAVNGVEGLAHLSPMPARLEEAQLAGALHASLYADGEVRVVLPAELLRPGGENVLELSCCDDGEVLREERVEARKRLDRMASAAGLIYQQIALARVEAGDGPVERLVVRPSVVYRRGSDGRLLERCSLDLELRRPVEGGELELRFEERDARQTVRLAVPAARFGHLRLPFELADGGAAVAYEVRGSLGGAPVEERGTVRRRPKWTVHVTPNAHTDIGYTHRQWEVAERLSWNIDQALGLGESSCYHLDSAWALEGYLSTRDEGCVQALARELAAGRISVSGIYVDLLSHHAALEDLVRNLLAADELLRRLGAKTDFVTIVDVASLSGALPALLEGAGIRYLAHASNQDRGPFRLNGGLHRLSPYVWEGVGGGRTLVWLARMYCELRKVCGSPPVPSSAERGLDLWLREYERPDYPGSAVLLFGQEADNTDLDPQPASFVRRWNDEFAYPRLRMSNVSDFFREVEASASSLPTVRGDGGAYWEDGVGSSAALAAEVRAAQAALPAAERLAALAAIHLPGARYPAEDFSEAWRRLLLWDEHTWGAFLSCREPDAWLQRDQWSVKEGFGREAAAWASRLLHAAATRHALAFPNEGREVVVHNPHSWTVSGTALVEIEPDELAVDVESGEPVPTRTRTRLSSQATVELWVESLPGLSYRRLRLERSPVASPSTGAAAPATLESPHYRLRFDVARGLLLGWEDLRLGRELVDDGAPFRFGQLLYARGGEGTRLISNQADLPPGAPELDAGFRLEETSSERFAFGKSVTFAGQVPAGRLQVEWVLHDLRPWIDVHYRYLKEERRSKEAVYVALPLALPGASVLSDGQLAWIDWSREALPGACLDWLPLQTGVRVRGEGCEVLICSPDIPLFCVGDIVRGRWSKQRDLTGGLILSYVLNNYWHTNYRACQGGEIRWSYRLTSGASLSAGDCYRLGWEARRPVYAHRMSLQDFRVPPAPHEDRAGGILASLDAEDVVLSTIKRASRGEGLVARLQEVGGRPARARLSFPGRRILAASRTDLVERDLAPVAPAADGSLSVEVPAWGLATVRLMLGDLG